MAFSMIRNVVSKSVHSRRSSASTGSFELVPRELLDLIISHLFDDRSALLSCALVHSSWNSISRYHLPPVMLIVSSPSRSKALVKLLRSSLETLSSTITGITLVGEIPLFDDSIMNSKFPRAHSYRKLLQVLKTKHVGLHLCVVENDPSLVGLFAEYFPALSELKVTCASYQAITSFMRALSDSFPRLTGLYIELGHGGMDLPGALQSSLRNIVLGMPLLRSLRVTGWNDDLVQWLGDNIVGTLE